MKIRILLADDHKIVCEGLRNLLEGQSDLEVVADTRNGPETIKCCQELFPDLVIMDISMPGLNGIETTRKILEQNPAIKVLALSMHSDRRFVIEMLKNGAAGYLLKDSAFDELIKSIRAVMKNQVYLSASISDMLLKEYITKIHTSDNSVFSVLSPREREVLQLLTEGYSTKEIASKLQVSCKTVESHRKQIMDKLKIHSLPELTKYAIREGITAL